MQIVRMVVLAVILVALGIFTAANWEPTITVRIWEGLVVDTKIPAIVLASFAFGFIPMYLLHRGTRWHLQRRIRSLESAARTAAMTPVAPPPAAETNPVTTPLSSVAEPEERP